MQSRIPNSSGSEKGQVAETCEHFIDILGSIKYRKFCYCLKTCQLLKMPAGPWNWSVGQPARTPTPDPTAIVVLNHLIVQVSISDSDILRSVWLLRTSHPPIAETSTWQCTKKDHIHAPGGIRTSIPASEQLQTHAATGIGTYLPRNN